MQPGKYSFLYFLLFFGCSSAAKLELVWQDEFSENELNLQHWTAIEGDGCPELCGFGNDELQYYTAANLKVEDGFLTLKAQRDTLGTRAYSSVKLITQNKGDWQYGRIEVRAKLPYGRGTWPAIWMLPTAGTKWPDDGEIDIMEHVGFNQGMVYGTIHTAKYNHMLGTQKSDSVYFNDLHEEFHTYSLDWDEESLAWSVDGMEYLELRRNGEGVSGWPFRQKFYLILNVAVGGSWGGKMGVADDIWPQEMIVDYIRVYQ